MPKRLVKFPSIEQFRNVVYDINHYATCTGLDENNNPIYDETLPKPSLTIYGTVKLHGTNMGVNYAPSEGIWASSREALISVGQDNAGGAAFVAANEAAFETLFQELIAQNKLTFDNDGVVTIYGEWAGQGIHKGTGINKLPKSYFIFAACYSEGESVRWLDSKRLRAPNHRIFNVEDYVTYTYEIDFNQPAECLPRLTELTQQIEACCPVAFAFGEEGIGEGIVWKADWQGRRYLFKTKGEKHSVVKTKEVATIAPEKLENIQAFVTYAVTENRFQQALNSVFGVGNPIDIRRLGEVMRWMTGDIEKEEQDTLKASGLTMKEVGKAITEVTRKMFMAYNTF